jgi:hypothetical protein
VTEESKMSVTKTGDAAAPVAAPGAVLAVLEAYVERGLFRSLRTLNASETGQAFRFKWHYGRDFHLVVDRPQNLVAFVDAFPATKPNGTLHREMATFVAAMANPKVPAHRRIDAKRAQIACPVSNDRMSIAAKAIDGSFDYATRCLIQTMNEIYFDFLPNSNHYPYQVAQLGLDPNAISFA